MINKQEILSHAKKYNLNANTIEKDYILNWLLAGIAASNKLNEKWISRMKECGP